MKSLIKLPAVMLGLLFLLTGTSQIAKAQYDDVSLQTFYDELSPYGTWINDAEYGYVWRPDVDQGNFRPYYTNGRWAMTEYGNTWVSNYEWGWAPFHYGRWIYNRYNRWVWLPDTTWGPAWVSWRSGGGYYGWAPMGPSFGVNVNIGIGDFYWNFIPYGQIYNTSYPRYYSGRNRVYIQNTVIINNTYVRNNRTYYTGPRVDDIRRNTNQNVTVYNVARTTRNGGSRIENNNVNIYSPRPSRGVENAKAMPRQVVQGNINNERVGRNEGFGRGGNVSNNGNRTFDNPRADRGANIDNNRESNTRNTERNGNSNGSIFGRSRERSEVDQSVPSTMQRSAETPARQERSREMSMPQRTENRGSQQAMPQRATERPQIQRVERSQPAQSMPSRSSGGDNSGRGSRGGDGGGRPGRG